MRAGFTDSRQNVLDAIYLMGATCCAYSMSDKWSEHCDCKYGVETGKWPTVHEGGNGCPELRSLYVVIEALSDEEWALLVHRANGTPRGFVFDDRDDIGLRLHRAHAAAGLVDHHLGELRRALAGKDSDDLP